MKAEKMKTLAAAPLFFLLLLTSCAPAPTSLPVNSPTASLAPTSTRVPTKTGKPETLIMVDGYNITDPRSSYPELFNLKLLNAPIHKFAGAIAMAGVRVSEDQISAELYYRRLADKDGNPFYAAIYHLDPDPQRKGENLEGDFPLLFATEEAGQVIWQELTLNTAASLHGMEFGALLHLDDEEQKIMKEQAGSGVVFIGWEYTHPSPEKHDWSELKFSVRWCDEHRLQVMAAPLIWGQAVPGWVHETADTPEALREIMLSHIDSGMGQLKGRVDYWEVVNETNHLDMDVFWEVLGPGYVNEAFARARSIDPDARLLYNDYVNLFDPASLDQDERIGVIEEVVSSLVADGNIDAIGLQIDGSIDSINIQRLEDALERLGKFDLPIIITEYSLRISGPETPERLSKQAELAAQVMQVLKQCDCVIQVNQWGMKDRLTNEMAGANTNAGLYYESGGRMFPKPVVYGIMAGFVLPPQDQQLPNDFAE